MYVPDESPVDITVYIWQVKDPTQGKYCQPYNFMMKQQSLEPISCIIDELVNLN